MIEKEKPMRHRSSPAAAVYKPPAARLADSKKSKDVAKPADSKLVKCIYLPESYTLQCRVIYSFDLKISEQLFH